MTVLGTGEQMGMKGFEPEPDAHPRFRPPVATDGDRHCPTCGHLPETVQAPKVATLTVTQVQAAYLRALDAIPPHTRGSATSLEAARWIATHARSMRSAVLCYLLGKGDTGASDDEGARELSMYRYTYAPRRVELESVGLVEQTGEAVSTGRGKGHTKAMRYRVIAGLQGQRPS